VSVIFSTDKGTSEESLNLKWSEFFTEAIEKFTRRKQQFLNSFGEADDDVGSVQSWLRIEYDEEASKILGPWCSCEQIFIPASRAFFSQFSETLFTRLDAGESFDPFIVAFGALLERSKSFLETRGFFGSSEHQHTEAKRLNEFFRSAFKKIMRAELGQSEKEYFLRFDDGRRVKLAQASSGHQEALPLLLLLARFFSTDNGRGRAVYLEEPEAHLFPSTQKQIIELLAEVFRARPGYMCLVLTTHSPYILTSINNLLQAGKLYDGAGPDVKRLEGVIPLSQTLRPGEVGFYALEDGGAKAIIDSETGLIDAAVIDGVSDEIATQFDELLLEGNEKRCRSRVQQLRAAEKDHPLR
jgi:hypothetical protein